MKTGIKWNNYLIGTKIKFSALPFRLVRVTKAQLWDE